MAKALILGSTGLTGSFVLQKTLESSFFTEVTVWVRKPLTIKHPKLKEHITDFKTLPNSNAEIVFSCLGTTKSKTPDPKAYQFIEVSIPVETAKSISSSVLKQFHYISSIGTSATGVSSYLKNKWEAESKLSKIGIGSLYIYRPSLIFGERKDTRILENISSAIFSVIQPLFFGPIKKYKRINAETIAEAMVKNAINSTAGKHILESDEIQNIGG